MASAEAIRLSELLVRMFKDGEIGSAGPVSKSGSQGQAPEAMTEGGTMSNTAQPEQPAGSLSGDDRNSSIAAA